MRHACHQLPPVDSLLKFEDEVSLGVGVGITTRLELCGYHGKCDLPLCVYKKSPFFIRLELVSQVTT